ncbi:MAG: peptidoglycan-associated lipoprotein Pal [Paracoccus sp. (in: a-proteobacteria)]|uniref:peptidoglycan-associated lipoprotein Pal n=1 Tax=Paracoccus sp. TaxID=267 RepID=UPI0026DF5B59|nr:peptidoglycan-associated lipoprotein Pal [Paracoccus sp. (in: a-proteobacteria)]MDO5622255.1 peptidoglycan-associated lipoprotein Pal [Paracoccus sp. (in: a-proteobacteria)]
MTKQTAPRRAPFWLTIPALLALAACAAEPVAQTPVGDPYATRPDGSAVYQGAIRNAPGVAVLPGTPTPATFASEAGDTVRFMAQDATLSPEARATLTRQAAWLARNTGFTARIEGHADDKGTREYNLSLGARRASAVQEYLVAQGVAEGRISTVSYGRERPVEVCTTEACFAQNRRAVTTVAPAGTS